MYSRRIRIIKYDNDNQLSFTLNLIDNDDSSLVFVIATVEVAFVRI